MAKKRKNKKVVYLPYKDVEHKFQTNNKPITDPYLPESQKVPEPLGYVEESKAKHYVKSWEVPRGNKMQKVVDYLRTLKIDCTFQPGVGAWIFIEKRYTNKNGAVSITIKALAGCWDGVYGVYIDEGNGGYERELFSCRTFNNFKILFSTINAVKK